MPEQVCRYKINTTGTYGGQFTFLNKIEVKRALFVISIGEVPATLIEFES